MMKPDFRAFLMGESCALSKDFFLKFTSLSIKHYNSTLRTRSIILWDLQSYVNFNQSFVRGMLFHQSDWSKISSIKMYVKYHSPSSCEILNKSIETFLGYSEKSWFYVDFNHFSGEVCSSTKAIDLFFTKSVWITTAHLYVKFQINWLKTFWVIMIEVEFTSI